MSYAGPFILGPCPACDTWQVEVPADQAITERELETILLEHDREAHPGVLLRMATLKAGTQTLQVTHPQEGWT